MAAAKPAAPPPAAAKPSAAKGMHTPAIHYLTGAAATMGAAVFSNPFEVMKTRMQLQGELKKRGQHATHYRNVFHAFGVVYKNEGIRGVQKGLGAGLMYQGERLSPRRPPSLPQAPGWQRLQRGTTTALLDTHGVISRLGSVRVVLPTMFCAVLFPDVNLPSRLFAATPARPPIPAGGHSCDERRPPRYVRLHEDIVQGAHGNGAPLGTHNGRRCHLGWVRHVSG